MEITQTHTKIWRWIALAAVLLNIFINYYANINPFNGQTIGDVSDQYPTLFTPAGYAFSIWGVIYLSFIIYVIYQLLPSQRRKPVYNRLAIPLILTSLFSIAWVISFSYEKIALSLLLILLMLITSILLFGWAKKSIFHQEANPWISIPFALYMGWLSVATIANAAVWLKDTVWQGSEWGETLWTVVMIAIAFVLGLLISWRFRDLVYPLVIAWATIAIYVARQNENAAVAMVALLAGVILVIWAIGFGIWLVRRHRLQTAV